MVKTNENAHGCAKHVLKTLFQKSPFRKGLCFSVRKAAPSITVTNVAFINPVLPGTSRMTIGTWFLLFPFAPIGSVPAERRLVYVQQVKLQALAADRTEETAVITVV